MSATVPQSFFCPLCGSPAALHHADGSRRFVRCPECTLIHVADPATQRSRAAGRAPTDQTDHLVRLADEVAHTVPAGSLGLDYGCGPEATLAHLLSGRGLACGGYDATHFPDEQALTRQYDFVACGEAVEATGDPAELFALFQRLLLARGVLAVRTELYDGMVPFAQWWYRREPARTCFYAPSTMRWIALKNRWKVRFVGRDISLFRA